jgi:hypothetical protein
MLFSNACRFVLVSLLSLSVNAETVRGDHTPNPEKRSEDVYLFRRDLFLKGGGGGTTQGGKKEAKVELMSAGNYAILAKTGISTVPNSVIKGDIAVSPAAAIAMTDFTLALDSTGTFSTSDQIMGKAFAVDYKAPIPSQLTTAVSAMEAAYTDAAGRDAGVGPRLNLGAGILGLGGTFGGATTPLTPGVYTFGTDVRLDGDIYFKGSDSDIFIIQISGNLRQAASYKVILTNGALAKNIFWQVAGVVEVGAGAHMEGILLVQTSVTFVTSSSLNGRVLTQTNCALQMATITQPVA